MTGYKDPRGTRAGRTWAAAIIKRDGQCMQCGHQGSKENPLVADHIRPVSKAPELALDLSNGQCLCKKHNALKSDKEEDGPVRKGWYHPQWLSSIN